MTHWTPLPQFFPSSFPHLKAWLVQCLEMCTHSYVLTAHMELQLVCFRQTSCKSNKYFKNSMNYNVNRKKDKVLALCDPNPSSLVYQEISARQLFKIYIYRFLKKAKQSKARFGLS
uniref:Uncharacterized protein n=1 Tax=Sphaerodactylus townsendi TaxID=933632 RepID=A0ACB8G9J2_9SAUR